MPAVQWLLDEYREWHAYAAVEGDVFPRTVALCGSHCLTGFMVKPIGPVAGPEAVPHEGERDGTIHLACMTAFESKGGGKAA